MIYIKIKWLGFSPAGGLDGRLGGLPGRVAALGGALSGVLLLLGGSTLGPFPPEEGGGGAGMLGAGYRLGGFFTSVYRLSMRVSGGA